MLLGNKTCGSGTQTNVKAFTSTQSRSALILGVWRRVTGVLPREVSRRSDGPVVKRGGHESVLKCKAPITKVQRCNEYRTPPPYQVMITMLQNKSETDGLVQNVNNGSSRRPHCLISCFVDHASLYNLVNKANLVHNLS